MSEATEEQLETTAEVEETTAGGLTDEERESRAEALAEVRTFGDPVLRSRASEVTEFGAELAREAERMVEIMHGAMGVGLAATQLGVLRRLLVFQAGPDAEATAVVNPQIEWLSEELATAEEGCLSLPGIGVDVERPLHARVRGVDVEGRPLLLEASGLEARVLQHEIDHLDGVLILDRTERGQRKAAMRALREGDTYSPSPEPGSELEPTTTTGEGRLPRHLRLRRRDPAAARRKRLPAGAGGHPARPAPGPRSPRLARARRDGRRGARDRGPADRGDRAPRGAGGDPRRASPSSGSCARSGSCCASRCSRSSSCSTSIRRCSRGGAARRRSSARSWPATPRPGSR